MRVSTTQYQFSHGKQPKGRGLWAFDVKLHSGSTRTEFATSGQTLAQAKREVLDRFQPGTVRELVVLP